MKALALLALLIAAPTAAVTIKDFNAKAPHDQAVYVTDFIEKMTADIYPKNPQLALNIRDYFARKAEGKLTSDGMERLMVELAALEISAQDGKADLSKTELEAVIVWIVKQKFPPSAR